MSRIVCQFSCGAASAVAAKLVLAEYPKDRVHIVNAFIVEEDEDNRRFLGDCERWLNHPITVLRDQKYGASVIEVFRRKQYMKGQYGASCSQALKRDVLNAFALPSDIYCLGYTAEEEDRFTDFKEFNPGREVIAPLIEKGLRKSDCLAMIERAGIVLPLMYRKGFKNANCKCCIKGGEGYMNKSRIEFPAEFNVLADVQESIGPGAYLFRDRKTNIRYSLRDLPADKGRYQDEPEISCSFFCEMAEQDIRNEAAV